MKNNELKKSVFLEIKREKLRAEALADKNLEIASKDEEFKKTYRKIKTLTFKIAEKEFLNESTNEDRKLLKENTQKLKEISNNLGFKLSDFKPNYSCKKCSDTGLVDEAYCDCFYQKLNKAIINNLGINVDNSHTFENANFEIFDVPEDSKRIYKTVKDWCENLNTTKYKTVLISGDIGVGKTYLVDCVCNNLTKKNVIVNYFTAFELSDLFLKYRLTFGESSSLEGVLSCDVLIVDDLGSEPNFKNNEEYFYLLFNERMVKNKFTVITTNFSPTQIMDRYGERTFSRLFNKASSLSIKINNKDLRIKIK